MGPERSIRRASFLSTSDFSCGFGISLRLLLCDLVACLDLIFCESDVSGFVFVFALLLFFDFAEVTGPKAWRKDSDRGAKCPLTLGLAASGGAPRREEVFEEEVVCVHLFEPKDFV